MKTKIIREMILWLGGILTLLSIFMKDGGWILSIFFYLMTFLAYYFLQPILEYGGIEFE